jgi:pimeloyl-ACP methyl ester carboxylesterase
MRFHTLTAILVAGLLALAGCATDTREGEDMGLYKDAEGKAIAHESYDRTMDLWPVEFEDDWVQTDYGTTHIIVAGPESGKPFFLMPGLFGDATMWYANAGSLAKQYRVYSVDLPVYGGKSEPSQTRIVDIAGYVGWFSELLDHYGYEETAIGGLSYGSWLSLALAREVPEAIGAVVMLDPSETFVKMDGGIAWKGFWSFAFFPNRAKYASFFDWLGGGYKDPMTAIWFEHMLDVIEYGSVGMFDVPQHRIYTAEELSMVTMPVLIMAGGKPILYKDPQEFAVAATTALPHAEIVIVPETGHSLNVEKADEVNERILHFLSENYL